MWAKKGSTVVGMYRHSGSFTTPIPICAATTSLPDAIALYGGGPPLGELALLPGRRSSRSGLETAQDEGLLHDARNLMGAIRLYCDLLSMPGVLKPEHRRYPEELRLLGTRSGALIEHLFQSLFQGGADVLAEDASSKAADGLPGAVESIANSRVRSKHSEDSKADAGRLVSR
jgi:hypothetical protein